MTGDVDRDVVVVGGGPAGCGAAVFLARADLDVVVFDRGASSLERCAYLENYLGFPAGIDVATFRRLATEHARVAGADVREDLVERVERADPASHGEDTGDGDGTGTAATDTDDGRYAPDHRPFRVETHDGRTVRTRYVLAATRQSGSYLRPVVGDAAFETHDHGDETHDRFDRDYADADGQTPVEGLYVASPAGERDAQAVVAAGQGAHVARTLLADRNQALGYPEGVLANRYDWLRPDAEFEGEWGDRERWEAWFDGYVPDEPSADDDRLEELRERAVDDAMATRRSDDEVAALTADGHRTLADHLDPDAVAAAADVERVLRSADAAALADVADDLLADRLAAVDDAVLRAALDGGDDVHTDGAGKEATTAARAGASRSDASGGGDDG